MSEEESNLPGCYSRSWGPEEVAAYLLACVRFVEWRSEGSPAVAWVDSSGKVSHMMDDNNDRWLAVARFVGERQVVTRDQLFRDYSHLIWKGEP